DDFKQQTLDSFQKELDAAIDFAEKAPFPEPEEALDHVYSFSIRDRELDRKNWTPTVLQK
ncbi:MAG: hypothetical protein JWO20_447, partial [Candidatus Angelobacter sp.]|nr:hypothetical protein [Candidatus Angelobacter sp.]